MQNKLNLLKCTNNGNGSIPYWEESMNVLCWIPKKCNLGLFIYIQIWINRIISIHQDYSDTLLVFYSFYLAIKAVAEKHF